MGKTVNRTRNLTSQKYSGPPWPKFPLRYEHQVGGDGAREGEIRRVSLAVSQHPRGQIGRGARVADGEGRQVAVDLLRDYEPPVRWYMRILKDDI